MIRNILASALVLMIVSSSSWAGIRQEVNHYDYDGHIGYWGSLHLNNIIEERNLQGWRLVSITPSFVPYPREKYTPSRELLLLFEKEQ